MFLTTGKRSPVDEGTQLLPDFDGAVALSSQHVLKHCILPVLNTTAPHSTGACTGSDCFKCELQSHHAPLFAIATTIA